jgi:hypothetical protein
LGVRNVTSPDSIIAIKYYSTANASQNASFEAVTEFLLATLEE